MKINWQLRLYPKSREEAEKEELERLLHIERLDKWRQQNPLISTRTMTEGEKRTLTYLEKKYLGG